MIPNYVMGVDLGTSEGDRSSCVILERATGRVVYSGALKVPWWFRFWAFFRRAVVATERTVMSRDEYEVLYHPVRYLRTDPAAGSPVEPDTPEAENE